MQLQKIRLANGQVRKVTPETARKLLRTGNYEDLGLVNVQPRKHAREASAEANTEANTEAGGEAGQSEEPKAEPKRTRKREAPKTEEEG